MLRFMKAATTVFNIQEIIKVNNLTPRANHANIFHCICRRCQYVNFVANNFCTNCGYPIKEEGTATLYQVRIKQRRELLKKTEKEIHWARTVLYILSIFF